MAVIFDKNTIPQIFLSASEPLCVKLAAEDLAGDTAKVSGQKPVLHDALPSDTDAGIVIGTLKNDAFAAYLKENNISTDNIAGKWEAYRIFSTASRVYILGSDERGTMWGIYEFCSAYLGVDPLCLWTDNEPSPMDSLTLSGIDKTDAPATYRFRGWFINDEDLLEGFSKGDVPERGYDFHGDYNRVLKLIVETALRLKQNLLIPCSHLDILKPEQEELVKTVTERGIFISMHHQEPVGVHQFTIDRYFRDSGIENINFIDHPDKYREVWTKYIRRWAKYDNVIWQLGLRGRGDRPVWYNNPRAPETTEERGKLIGDAMQMQYDIIREECPGKELYFSSTLWMEGMPLYKERALRFPENTIIVLSDFGPNQMWGEGFYTTPRFDDYNYGLYYHLAFWGCGPHIVQGNPPEKILFNYQGAVEKGDRYYSVINVSNIREHLYEIAYSAQITWNIENSDIAAFRRNWCRSQFGTDDSAALEEVYADYFDAFHRMDSTLIPDHMLLMDGMCKRVAWKLIQIIGGAELRKDDIQNKKLYDFDSTDAFIAYYTAATEESIPKFDMLMQKALEARETVHESRKAFFDSNMLVHIAMINALYHWVNHLAKAAAISRTGEKTADFDAHILAGAAALRDAVKIREKALYGGWEHWYDGDRLMNLAGDAQATEEILT